MKKIFLLYILSFSLTGCIGCKNVFVNYVVENISLDIIYIKGNKSFEVKNAPDTIYKIIPFESVIIKMDQKICWFGDCRNSFNSDPYIKTIKIFKDQNLNELVIIDSTQWQFKKKEAKLLIK